jgi:hypothetical protein
MKAFREHQCRLKRLPPVTRAALLLDYETEKCTYKTV